MVQIKHYEMKSFLKDPKPEPVGKQHPTSTQLSFPVNHMTDKLLDWNCGLEADSLKGRELSLMISF